MKFESNRWKETKHVKTNHKTRVAILISDKIDFKIKSITTDKEGHFIIIKVSIHQKDIIIINTYAPIRTSKCTKQNQT